MENTYGTLNNQELATVNAGASVTPTATSSAPVTKTPCHTPWQVIYTDAVMI